MTLDLITAMLLGGAALFTGLREIALSPRNESFPKAPGPVRLAMFIFAVMLAGGAMLFWGSVSVAGDYAGQASGPVVAFALGLALYQSVMLANLIRQRYRPEVWRRLNRASETVRRSCPELKPRIPVPIHLRRVK